MLKWFCLSRTRHMKLCSEDSCNYPCCNLRRKVSDMFRDLKNNVNLAKDLWFPDSNRLSIALRRYRNHMKHLHSWRFMTFFNNIWLCLPLSHICKCCATALEGRYYWHGHGEGGFSWLVQRNGLSSCRGQEKLDAFIKALDQFASSWGHCESLAPFSEPWTLSGLRSIFRGKKRASLIYADFCFFFFGISLILLAIVLVLSSLSISPIRDLDSFTDDPRGGSRGAIRCRCSILTESELRRRLRKKSTDVGRVWQSVIKCNTAWK
jgi:hypothetical protein